MKAGVFEYHVFAKFPCNVSGVRVAVTLTERTARRIGSSFMELADDVWYKCKLREPGSKPWRRRRNNSGHV